VARRAGRLRVAADPAATRRLKRELAARGLEVVVGLTPRLLAHMPKLAAVADTGWRAELGTVLPAVTCSVQSTLLAGAPPREHGIVGNGWYFRELGEVLLWRQHNRLVGGEKLWDAARRAHPGYTVANICWWYAMGADVDWTVTPRPIYYADGRKEPDCYTYRKPGYDPAELLFDPAGPGAAKLRAGIALLRKKLGLRYLMSVVGLDAGAAAVRGSHGRLPERPEDGPVLLCSVPAGARSRYESSEVKQLLLQLADIS
jgi:Type I phosphodiesterase / nucleotide pyrophosphatase